MADAGQGCLQIAGHDIDPAKLKMHRSLLSMASRIDLMGNTFLGGHTLKSPKSVGYDSGGCRQHGFGPSLDIFLLERLHPIVPDAERLSVGRQRSEVSNSSN